MAKENSDFQGGSGAAGTISRGSLEAFPGLAQFRQNFETFLERVSYLALAGASAQLSSSPASVARGPSADVAAEGQSKRSKASSVLHRVPSIPTSNSFSHSFGGIKGKEHQEEAVNDGPLIAASPVYQNEIVKPSAEKRISQEASSLEGLPMDLHSYPSQSIHLDSSGNELAPSLTPSPPEGNVGGGTRVLSSPTKPPASATSLKLNLLRLRQKLGPIDGGREMEGRGDILSPLAATIYTEASTEVDSRHNTFASLRGEGHRWASSAPLHEEERNQRLVPASSTSILSPHSPQLDPFTQMGVDCLKWLEKLRHHCLASSVGKGKDTLVAVADKPAQRPDAANSSGTKNSACGESCRSSTPSSNPQGLGFFDCPDSLANVHSIERMQAFVDQSLRLYEFSRHMYYSSDTNGSGSWTSLWNVVDPRAQSPTPGPLHPFLRGRRLSGPSVAGAVSAQGGPYNQHQAALSPRSREATLRKGKRTSVEPPSRGFRPPFIRSKRSSKTRQGEAEVINQYKVIKVLGHGTTGTVYLASDTKKKKLVAIKSISVRERRPKLISYMQSLSFSDEVGAVSFSSGSEFVDVDQYQDAKNIEDMLNPLNDMRQEVDPCMAIPLSAGEMEIRILRQLNHPYVIPLLEAIDDPEEQLLHLVLPFASRGAITTVDSNELGKDVTHCKVVRPFSKLKRYVQEIIEALIHVHFKNFVHNDVKPDNVLLDDDDHVLLVDFGTSRRVPTQRSSALVAMGSSHPSSFTVSQTRSPTNSLYISNGVDRSGRVIDDQGVGTPAFSAPELLGENWCTPHSDSWSLGVMIFSMLYGYLPFSTRTFKETIEEVLFKPIVYLSYEEFMALPPQASLANGTPNHLNETLIPEEYREWVRLCESLLQREPHLRWPLGCVLNNPFFSFPQAVPVPEKFLHRGSACPCRKGLHASLTFVSSASALKGVASAKSGLTHSDATVFAVPSTNSPSKKGRPVFPLSENPLAFSMVSQPSVNPAFLVSPKRNAAAQQCAQNRLGERRELPMNLEDHLQLMDQDSKKRSTQSVESWVLSRDALDRFCSSHSPLTPISSAVSGEPSEGQHVHKGEEIIFASLPTRGTSEPPYGHGVESNVLPPVTESLPFPRLLPVDQRGFTQLSPAQETLPFPSLHSHLQAYTSVTTKPCSADNGSQVSTLGLPSPNTLFSAEWTKAQSYHSFHPSSSHSTDPSAPETRRCSRETGQYAIGRTSSTPGIGPLQVARTAYEIVSPTPYSSTAAQAPLSEASEKNASTSPFFSPPPVAGAGSPEIFVVPPSAGRSSSNYTSDGDPNAASAIGFSSFRGSEKEGSRGTVGSAQPYSERLNRWSVYSQGRLSLRPTDTEASNGSNGASKEQERDRRTLDDWSPHSPHSPDNVSSTLPINAERGGGYSLPPSTSGDGEKVPQRGSRLHLLQFDKNNHYSLNRHQYLVGSQAKKAPTSGSERGCEDGQKHPLVT